MSTKTYNSEPLVQTNEFLPLEIECVSPEMIRIAEEQLNETPESRKEALKQMRRCIHAENDFRPVMDDTFLLRFLRARKFNVEAAFKLLKNYYTYKVRYSRKLTDILPSEVEFVFDLNIISVLSHRDRDGSVIGAGKAGSIDLDKVSIDDLLATVILITEVQLLSEATQICGATFIIDFKGISLRLVRHLASPTILYRVVKGLQDCLPIRLKAIHIINEPFYFSIIFNVLRRFLSDKLKNRNLNQIYANKLYEQVFTHSKCVFQFHGSNLRKLHDLIPPEILPKEFGGHKGPLCSAELAKEVSSHEKNFAKMYKYGYQEKKAQFIRKKSSMALGLFA